ncbi:MAG: gliding motility-associated C-terminal domain-containing protein [Bacteroidia bacterium]|nr:gliding motility-associated C-terminal domain-containing protein [Bacteroidia bacterium]
MRVKNYILGVMILLFSFLGNTVFAQINVTVTTTNIACNNTSLGKIELSVLGINPPFSFEWSSGQTTPTIESLQAGIYAVTVSDNAGNDTSLSVQIVVRECEMIPEIIFTPNGDGYNDTWFIQNSQYFSDALVQVFDRLGQLVYEHQGKYESWDGKNLLGVPLPDASYFFIVYKNKNEKSNIVKGSVSILR